MLRNIDYDKINISNTNGKEELVMYPRSVSSPVTILSQEKKGNTTVVKFSNGGAWLDSITVDSSDVFFSRPCRLSLSRLLTISR